MSKVDDSGTAFPTEYNDRGLTIRDYFAAAALQGLLASGHFTHDGNEYSDSGPWMTDHQITDEDDKLIGRGLDVTEAAWKCADIMIRERKEANDQH
jgi:hypothetical protein